MWIQTSVSENKMYYKCMGIHIILFSITTKFGGVHLHGCTVNADVYNNIIICTQHVSTSFHTFWYVLCI